MVISQIFIDERRLFIDRNVSSSILPSRRFIHLFSFSGHEDITHPFVGQYVDEEAVSTSQVHECLPGSEALPCTLLGPEHLQE